VDTIEFVSTLEGLDKIEKCRPKPAKSFIPDWFKNIPSSDYRTVKICPSFPDYFSLGYIMPMWTDTYLTYDPENIMHEWATENNMPFQIHGNNQFIDYVDPYLQGVKGKFVFKSVCPWEVITPPGWSVLQLPLYYHFNRQWSVLPGVVDTDIVHQLNHQILYYGDGETIKIKQGDPLVLYVPFKRDSRLGYEVRYQTEKDKERFKEVNRKLSEERLEIGSYRAMQRERDKNL